MATPAREPDGLPMDIFLRSSPVDEAEFDHVMTLFSRNREYLFSRWDELIRDHRGMWAAAYGGCHLVLSEDREGIRSNISGDIERRSAFIWLLDDAPDAIRGAG